MTFKGGPSQIKLKRAMRAAAVERRRVAHQHLAVVAAERVMTAFLVRFGSERGSVSAYWPIGDELDVRPLIEALSRRGCTVALPVVTAPRQPLEFRAWRAGDPLEPGSAGTWHPTAAAPAVRPEILLVPLLAFDRRGCRLGYGGGYYDRTLAALRRTGPMIAVGVGYAAQEVAAVPVDDYDQRLDVALTEEDTMEFEGQAQ